jgi:predicted AlkP superfamily pyrophosphatase or phosphodiesterase
MEDEPALFLKWLDVGPAQRPRFLTLYFYYVDSVGHSDGPNSAALNDELRKVDIAIGNLVEGLRARGVLDQTNIIVTADHGMSEVAPSNDIFLDDLIDPAALHVISAYTTAQIAPAPGVAIDQIAAKLVGKHRHMECWRKENVPARFHYRRNPRIPPIICLAEPGWMISTRAGHAPHKAVTGAHGYDPQTADMTAIFVAAGPAFRSGARLPPISNLEFYPMLAKLIGVKPERSGRTGFPFKSALKD